MLNVHVTTIPLTLRSVTLEVADEYSLPRTNSLSLSCAAFEKLQYIFSSYIVQRLKTKVFNQCVLPVMTYGTET